MRDDLPLEVRNCLALVDSRVDQIRAQLSEWGHFTNLTEILKIRDSLRSNDSLTALAPHQLDVVRQLAFSGMMLAMKDNIDKIEMENDE